MPTRDAGARVLHLCCARGRSEHARRPATGAATGDPATCYATGARCTVGTVIFIVVKFPIKPEHADNWPNLVQEFTDAVRGELGNVFFEWSRDIDDPNTYTLVEAFADGDAGGVHVQSEHFQKAIGWMPDYVTSTPRIINVEIPDATGWSEMGEVAPRQ